MFRNVHESFKDYLEIQGQSIHASFDVIVGEILIVYENWAALLVLRYLFSGGAFAFYFFLRVAGHRLDNRMSSLNAFRVEEPIEQVPLHKWCP